MQTPGPYSIWWEGGGGGEAGEEAVALVGLGFGEDACKQAAALERDDGGKAAAALVVKTLGAVFGADVVGEKLLGATSKSWAVDPLTYNPDGAHREYGHPLLRQPLPWGVHFAGTETEPEHGHVEGAIAAGERAAQEVLAGLK